MGKNYGNLSNPQQYDTAKFKTVQVGAASVCFEDTPPPCCVDLLLNFKLS
jgi:hypothetical protein